ncbi:DUF6197 family protein [Phytohabitans kaempferiae]|uniref:Uncharacterized protein n=1 Tax=Phytohabitans kaempferiae TaxID=1620943 RepID=A0ABV6M0I9_9ACTN
MTTPVLTPVPADANPAVVLRAAADYIDQHGWLKGALYPEGYTSCPPACVTGAIRIVVCGRPSPDAKDRSKNQTTRILVAERVFAAHLGHTFDPDQTRRIRLAIETWNDRAWRSVIDVTNELRAAATAYDDTNGGAR